MWWSESVHIRPNLKLRLTLLPATCSVSHNEHELKTNELHTNANTNGSVANEAKHNEPNAKKGEGWKVKMRMWMDTKRAWKWQWSYDMSHLPFYSLEIESREVPTIHGSQNSHLLWRENAIQTWRFENFKTWFVEGDMPTHRPQRASWLAMSHLLSFVY